MVEQKRQPPHVFLILAGLLLLASALTWLIPAGSFQRVMDGSTGQTVVIPDSFAFVRPSPVAPWRLPRHLHRLRSKADLLRLFHQRGL